MIDSRLRAPSGAFTLYCDNSGSDSITMAQALLGTPFATPNAALYAAAAYLDFDSTPMGQSKMTISLAAGQTFGPIHYSLHAQTGAQGGEAVKIVGGQDSNGVWSKIKGTGVSAVGVYSNWLWLENVILESDQNGLDAISGAKVRLKNVMWGACTTAHINIEGAGNTVEMVGDCSIVGNASYHIVTQGGYFKPGGYNLNIQCNLTLTQFILATGPTLIDYQGSAINLNGHTVTGQRYNIYCNASVLGPTGGFPGSTAGTVSLGGQYA